MPILPIDTGRYGTPEMKRIFEEETRVQKMLDVEAALAWAHAEVGNVPRKDAKTISEKASTRYVKLERVRAIESQIKHSVFSLVKALAEQCGSSSAYVHLGATSSDIIDTAMALILRDAIGLIEQKLDDLEGLLINIADKHKKTVMIGRTHGQHALPITSGFKFAVWMREVARHIQRIHLCRERLLVGKMSGAVGTQAGLGQHAAKIQELVMKTLGLSPADISNQIVQRDRYAELVCLLALVASSLENFATEIRELQRPEIGELFEAFEAGKQVGSSTMSHKRNPELCERVCGLSRIVRSLVAPAFENMVTWHERDLTQSSAERFILPEACILTDYLLFLMNGILTNLRVDEQRMLRNMEVTEGRNMSEAVMIALTRKRMNRQEASELLRELTIESEKRNCHLNDVLANDCKIRKLLTESEIANTLDPQNYLGTTIDQVELMVKRTLRERVARGVR